MYSRYDLKDTHIVVYYQSNNEFEQVRKQCLEENNWLRHNYTQDNLRIEDHHGYGVVYQVSTGKPMVMGGVFNDGRYPSTVAKMINRLYTFPEFRMTHTDMTDGFRVTCSLIDRLIADNSFECYLITMQNRPRGGKRWWDIWKQHMDIASDNKWQHGLGYIQTCPWPVQKCWQNFVYRNISEHAFENWNPTIINDQEWNMLPEGK
jgi:hypothetical protein